MIKKRKIIFFIMIILTCVGGLIIKDNTNSNEGVYVLSEEKDNNSNNVEVNDEDKDIKSQESTNISSKEVTVYVSGAVNSPGVVTLNQGDRLSDAVAKVGGTTENADFNQVNLAIKVEDEKHYIIPKIGEKVEEVDNKVEGVNNNEESSTKININSATIEELDTLPGVGEATANKILNYRNENGEFESIEEIKNVNGIGDKKYEELKELIIIE